MNRTIIIKIKKNNITYSNVNGYQQLVLHYSDYLLVLQVLREYFATNSWNLEFAIQQSLKPKYSISQPMLRIAKLKFLLPMLQTQYLLVRLILPRKMKPMNIVTLLLMIICTQPEIKTLQKLGTAQIFGKMKIL